VSDYILGFSSVYLYSPFSQITNLPQRALQSEHIDILTFDLTSDQEQLRNNPSREKKREEPFRRAKNPSGEQQRRIPLQD